MEQLNVSATIDAQNLLVSDLIVTAGFPRGTQLAARDEENWPLVARAGIYEVGRQCDQYLDVLFSFNRVQRAGRQDLAAAAAAAGAIMGLTGVSSKAIGITAAAFGLASSLFEAHVDSVLFTIEPSALRNIVLRGRNYYLKNLDVNKIQNRPDTLLALQGYLTQCSPAAIEANINNAAAGSLSVSWPEPEKAKEAALLAAPGAAPLQQPKTGGSPVDWTSPPPPPPPPPRPPPPPPSGKSVEQRAKDAVNQEINRRLLPFQPAPNLQPGEPPLTGDQTQKFQAALGVTANGDPGQAGSDTRKKLQEFQIGMSKRPDASWPAEETSGNLGVRTVSQFTGMKPMPRYFLSPFERAYLGNRLGDGTNAAFDVPDVERLKQVLDLLLDNLNNNPGLTGKVEKSRLENHQKRFNDEKSTVDEKLKLMREMIADIRKNLPLDPKRLDLDFVLYDKVNPK